MSSELPFDPLQLNRPWDWALKIPQERLPILVTGVAGVVGFNAFHFLQQKYPGQVYGIRPLSNSRLIGEGILGLDPEDRHQLRQLFREIPFRSILSCGGSCALKSCELDPAMAQRVNVQSIQSILETIESHSQSVRLIHTSIDLVYSGNSVGGYQEHLPADPVTVYGKTMVEAERAIQTRQPNAMIVRISLPMGLSFNGHAGAIDWIQNRFANGRPATLYFDEIRTPTYTHCMNHFLEHVLTTNHRGIYHGGGPTRISLYQIAQIINRVGGYDPDLLHGCHRIQAGPIPPRAGNVTMRCDRLQAEFGADVFQPWPLDRHWLPTSRHWHFERDRDEPGSPARIAEVLYNHPGHFDGAANQAIRPAPSMPANAF